MMLLQEPESKSEQLTVAHKNPTYNWIYEHLVQDENDLVGAIAYVLYKQHKIEFIKSIESNGSSSGPTEEQWSEFHRSTCLESNILNYQHRAQNLVNQFLRDMLTQHYNKLEADADQRTSDKVSLITTELREKIIELETTIKTNHSTIENEIKNKKGVVARLGEALLNIVYGLIIIAVIGGLVGGYKWLNNLNSSAEKATGITNEQT